MGLTEGSWGEPWWLVGSRTVSTRHNVQLPVDTDVPVRWITPSIFQQFPGHDTVDEFTLCQNHPDTAPGILKNHWDNFVGQSDFQTIVDAGFNTVRVPVGCESPLRQSSICGADRVSDWAFQKFNDPYIQGAAPYIDQAITWARSTGLKVWIDLHGAPGSQNGYDNSGHNGTIGWGGGNTVSDTRSVIQQIANKYAKAEYQDVVVAIQVLNEPQSEKVQGGPDTVVQFYKDAFGDIKSVSDTPVILHDGFQEGTFWNGILTDSSTNVIIDHHEYQIFTPELIDKSPEEHVSYVYSNAGLYSANTDHWVVVGEWSAAMTDCAAALNGYGLGSRWEGSFPLTGAIPSDRFCGCKSPFLFASSFAIETKKIFRSGVDALSSMHFPSRSTPHIWKTSANTVVCLAINYIDTWNQTLKDNTSKYINAQLDVFEKNTEGMHSLFHFRIPISSDKYPGWVFWNFKTEASAEWDLQRLLAAGVFPSLKGR